MPFKKFFHQFAFQLDKFKILFVDLNLEKVVVPNAEITVVHEFCSVVLRGSKTKYVESSMVFSGAIYEEIAFRFIRIIHRLWKL